MSQLDQAKKEAKRLFNLAKANAESQNNTDNNNNYLVVENLSKSREILSHINGYKNWHEYEEVLKRKDFLYNKVDKNTKNKENKIILNNLKDYIEDISFNTIINPVVNNHSKLIIEKEHTPIIIGRQKEKKLFETKEKKWVLNNYPVLWTGSTGAGKTETLLSMSSQYIENNEGVIYFDGKGESVLYSKMFGYAEKTSRLNDLYCLNFMTGSRNWQSEINNERETLSHSIDPINPMLGCDQYFSTFFGRFGNIVHSILKDLHKKDQLMDTQSLKSILMLNNLLQWYKDKKFNTPEIADYLVEIGLSLDNDNDEEDFNEALEKHAFLAHTAYETVKLFEQYGYVFKIDCSVNMEKIFLERKILVVLLPALEKSTFELANLGTLLVMQIKYIEEKYQKYKTHFQNIIIDEFNYFADCLVGMNLKNTKNNYIFGCYSYYYRIGNEIFEYVINNANTMVIMKNEDPHIHTKIKLDILDNMEEMPKLKWGYNKGNFTHNFMHALKDQREGQAYVLGRNSQKAGEDVINNDYKYYCESLLCEYIPAKKPKRIWLVDHPKPLIYIKENVGH